MVNKKIQLDFTEEGLCEKIEVVQGDTGRVLVCNIIGVDMTNVSARFYAVKNSGKEIYNNCTVSQNTVTIELTEQTLAEVGIVKCQLDLRKGNQKVQSFIFDIDVTASLMAQSEYLSSDEYKVVDDLADKVEKNENKIAELDDKKANKDDYGSPLKAKTVAEMTDKKKVYVYVGTETGYINGNWYTWEETAWISGGVYNSAAIQTDKTLTQSDKAADSAIVGQQIGSLKESKVSSNQGEENSGKYLSIGEDGNIKLSDPPNNGGEIEDENGNKYLIYVKEDGTIGLKKQLSMFPGKNIVSDINYGEFEQQSDNRYAAKDKITKEIIYGHNTGNLSPYKSFQTGISYIPTKALEKMIANESGNYTFVMVQNSNGGDTSNISVSILEETSVTSINEFGAQGWNTITNQLLSIPYTDNSDEAKTYTVAKTESSVLRTDLKGVKENWNKNINAFVFKNDGTISIIMNGTLVRKYSAPEDFKKWNMGAIATSNWNLGTYRKNVVLNNKVEGIILNDILTENDIENYYKYLNSSVKANGFVSQNEIYLQVGDDAYFEYKILPDGYLGSANIAVEDNTVARVDGDRIIALKNGTTNLILKCDDIVKSIPVVVGKQVSDSAQNNIEALATKDVDTIIIVNEDDLPQKMNVGDEFAVYALGINTASDIPYSVSEQNMVVYESSNPDVCSVEYGVLKANKKGTAVITISSVKNKNATTSLTVNVDDVKEEIIAERDIYRVDDRSYDIYNNESNAENTTKGIKKALLYASEQGYKKIIFNYGSYLIDPAFCPIKIPENLIVDFNRSVLKPYANNQYISGKKIYCMFDADDANNSKVINAKIYGENYYGSNYHVEGETSLSFNSCENLTIEDCEFSYGPGFNLSWGYSWVIDGKDTRTPFRLDNVEIGNIDDSGNNDDVNTTGRFRSKNFIDISKLKNTFGLGNMQGYQGYLYMSSRLYNIYFYDDSGTFLSCKKWCVQYQEYKLPENAKKAKIVFFQSAMPTKSEGDFNSIAMLYSLKQPKNAKIKNCTFKENVSTAICPQGGKNIIIENCTFENNGLLDPASTIDWEDGRIHIQGHILRHNTFTKTDSKWNGMLNIINGRDITIHDNKIMVPFFNGSESQNSRIYRNVFNVTQSSNLSLQSKTDMIFCGNVYNHEPTTKQPVGGNIIQADNVLVES